MKRNVRAVIVAANDLTRNGMAALLKGRDGRIEVVGVYRSLEEAETTFKPDDTIVLLLEDVLPPRQSLHPVLRRLRREYPNFFIIVLSSKLTSRYLQSTFEGGASGFIYLEDRLEESLPIAIETVVLGSLYTSPQASSVLVWSRINRGNLVLNSTDMEVLRLLNKGLSVQEVSERMEYHIRSVYRIRQKLCAVLDVPTSDHLIDAARQKGLLGKISK